MAEQTVELYTGSATGAQIDNAAAKVAAMEENLSGTAGTIPSSAAVQTAINAKAQELSEDIEDAVIQNEVILPSNVYLFSNQDYSIYKTNILNGVDNRNDIDLFATGLKNYNRQFVANIAEDKSVPIVGFFKEKKETLCNISLKAVDSASMSGKRINVLCIGDSFTDMGYWVNEIYQQLNTAGADVKMIGTTKQSSGEQWLCEGLSGATLDWVVNNRYVGYIINVTSADGIPSTTYTSQFVEIDGKNWTVRGTKLTENNGVYSGKILLAKYGVADQELPSSGTATMRGISVTWDSVEKTSFNPFWNRTESKVDFNWYLTKWGFDTPDIVCIQFGLNDLAAATDASLTAMMANLSTLISAIHLQLPKAGIVISIPPFCGVNLSGTTGGNTNRLDMKLIIQKYAKALYEVYDNEAYSDYVAIAPSFAFVDRVNGYGSVEKVLNSRFPNAKDVVYTDSLHCNEQGMRQIGDCVSPIVCKLFSELHTFIEYNISSFTAGYSLNNSGIKAEAAATATRTYYLSDFISIEGAVSIDAMALCDNSSIDALAFYSNNNEQSFISSVPRQEAYNTVKQPRMLTIPGAAGPLFEGETLTIPQGAKYIRVSSIVATDSFSSGQEPSVTVYYE